MLWHAVDAEDVVAVYCLASVFRKCVPKIVANAPDDANPLVLADARPGLDQIVAAIEDAYDEADLCPSPCSEADQARLAKFCFCAPRDALADRDSDAAA